MQRIEVAHLEAGLREANRRTFGRAEIPTFDFARARIARSSLIMASVRASLRASLRLRRLHPMQAPVLARAWVEAIPSERLADERIADTLQLACRLLGTPHPHALATVRPEHVREMAGDPAWKRRVRRFDDHGAPEK